MPPRTRYSVPNGFEGFDVKTACDNLKAEQQATARHRRERLKYRLKAILKECTEDGETFASDLKHWSDQIITELDVDTSSTSRQSGDGNAGYNYYYDENWYKTEHYFNGLFKAVKEEAEKDPSRRGEIAKKLRITESYGVNFFLYKQREVVRKKLQLLSLREGRENEYVYLMQRIENLLVSNAEERNHFKGAWSVPISKQVEQKSKQFGNVETWLPIEAVLRYIVEKVAEDKVGSFAEAQNIVWFFYRYEKSEVLEKMGFESVPSVSSETPATSPRWSRRVGRVFCFTSKSNSLDHRSRIGIRQLRMRAIVLDRLEEAQDGGYYF